MNNSLLSQRPDEGGPLVGLVRLVRRICVLREQGDAAGADRLRDNDLACAVRDLRLARGPEVLPDAELQALFAAEERRVAEAAVVVELLLPRLSTVLRGAPRLPTTTGRAEPPPRAVSARVVAAAGSPAIPDLLDAMLAAERTSRRLPVTIQPES